MLNVVACVRPSRDQGHSNVFTGRGRRYGHSKALEHEKPESCQQPGAEGREAIARRAILAVRHPLVPLRQHDVGVTRGDEQGMRQVYPTNSSAPKRRDLQYGVVGAERGLEEGLFEGPTLLVEDEELHNVHSPPKLLRVLAVDDAHRVQREEDVQEVRARMEHVGVLALLPRHQQHCGFQGQYRVVNGLDVQLSHGSGRGRRDGGRCGVLPTLGAVVRGGLKRAEYVAEVVARELVLGERGCPSTVGGEGARGEAVPYSSLVTLVIRPGLKAEDWRELVEVEREVARVAHSVRCGGGRELLVDLYAAADDRSRMGPRIAAGLAEGGDGVVPRLQHAKVEVIPAVGV
mmetsp:Transcript_11694/g.32567  ORF Transcript_11694/g.32567 Transcript_11694/m.32567 type:complete len:346 (+) Transcript_11694:432-1469(+)